MAEGIRLLLKRDLLYVRSIEGSFSACAPNSRNFESRESLLIASDVKHASRLRNSEQSKVKS